MPPISPLAPTGGFPELPPVNGVRFSACEAGIRYAGRKDLMLAEIASGSSIAGVFTRSQTRSAPVLWCEDCLKRQNDAPGGFAILVNSGNSNAFTGGRGFEGVERCTKATADSLNIPHEHVYMSSTGVIGEPLPTDKVLAKIEDLKSALSPLNGRDAADAIMTTDTFAKGVAMHINLDGVDVVLTGFAKGSGMIAPDMATMLVYMFTDAAIAQPMLQKMVSEINAVTFNSITVDSDTSTSDTLLMAATGRAEMTPITSQDDPRYEAFSRALHDAMRDLAHQVVRDGEGATKFVEIQVQGASSDASAHVIGKAIANSPLVKTAIAGEDPNWGRIVMAVGKSGEPADRDLLSIRFGEILVAENGWVSPSYKEQLGADYMKNSELLIDVDMGIGTGRATIWTCDLTHQYITINADYRS